MSFKCKINEAMENYRITPGEVGTAKADTFEVSKSASMASIFSRDSVFPGEYQRLLISGCVMMSNTRMEINSNIGFAYQAEGSILISGLGMGMILRALLTKESVTDITVLEKNPDVIKLVGPNFKDDDRVTIIEADAFEWKPPKGKKWDYIWHDIWVDICTDNLKEITKLKRKFGKRCVHEQQAWMESRLRYIRQQDKKRRW